MFMSLNGLLSMDLGLRTEFGVNLTPNSSCRLHLRRAWLSLRRAQFIWACGYGGA